MKKIISYYYIFLEIILFLFFCLEDESIFISGILYHFGMIIFVGVSIFITIKFNDILKFKRTFYITLIIYFLVLNNIYLFLLLIFLFFAILLLNYKNKIICYTFAFISTVVCLVLPITIIFILSKCINVNISYNPIRNMAYDEYYYECGKYDIFYYSAGATDSFHFAVMKKHNYVKIGNLLGIISDKQVGDTIEEYNNIKKENICKKKH